MVKPQTVAALELVSIDGKKATVNTSGTKAAPGAKLIWWELHWGDGRKNQDPGAPFTQLDHEYEIEDEYQAVLIIKDSKNRVTSSPMIIIRIDSETSPSPPALQIVTPSLPNGQTGIFYSQPLQGTGGVPPYSWSIFSGVLPNGLSLIVDTIQGTPTVSNTFNFQVRLQDSLGQQVFRNYSITISSIPLQITSSSPLPNASQGESYNFPIGITGGVPPYILTKTIGNFPTGISISGTSLVGIPTVIQTQIFTLRATDDLGSFVDKQFSLSVVLEGPNDYFDEMVARPDHYFDFSYRNQAAIDSVMRNTVDPEIISSTAATPTIINAGTNKTQIVSSLDGVFTCAVGHRIITGNFVQIIGHSLGIANGVHVATRIDGTHFSIPGITGSGTGGFSFRSGHCLYNQEIVTISGHVAIPNGTYVANVINSYQCSIETLAGAPVSSSGGGNAGIILGKCWEYFPDTGRIDDFAIPQIAARGTIPIYFRQALTRQLHLNFSPTGDSNLLVCQEIYLTNTWIDATVTQKGPRKTWTTETSTRVIGAPFVSAVNRTINIQQAFSGNPTRVNGVTLHYLNNGDQVVISGSSSIPNGTYTVTILNSTDFTIPINTVSPSSNGSFRNTIEVGRVGSTIQGATPAWLWGVAANSNDDYFPLGAGLNSEFYPWYCNTWSRFWKDIRPNKIGSDFTSWNTAFAVPAFGLGYVIGRRNITVSVDGGGVGTFICTEGPHGFLVNNRVVISGIPSLNGTYTIATIPTSPTGFDARNGGFTGPTTFTINGLTPGSAGSGIADLKYSMLSIILSDENRNPFYAYKEIPIPDILHDFRLFRQELDASEEEPLDTILKFYAKNMFILKDPIGTIDLSNTTIFRKPIG